MISKETIKEIKKVHAEGMPVEIISDKYLMSPPRVMDILTGVYEQNLKPKQRVIKP